MVIENVWVLCVCFLMWLFLVCMMVIEIFGGIGKKFRVYRYAFLFIWKLQVNKVGQKYLLYTSAFGLQNENFFYNSNIKSLLSLSEIMRMSSPWHCVQIWVWDLVLFCRYKGNGKIWFLKALGTWSFTFLFFQYLPNQGKQSVISVFRFISVKDNK